MKTLVRKPARINSTIKMIIGLTIFFFIAKSLSNR